MDTREKLIELLRQVQYLGGLEEKIADHLIANGVTIPVQCKDCDYYEKEYRGFGFCTCFRIGVADNDFCSRCIRRCGE